jgi:excisionase family DNA binding protein
MKGFRFPPAPLVSRKPAGVPVGTFQPFICPGSRRPRRLGRGWGTGQGSRLLCHAWASGVVAVRERKPHTHLTTAEVAEILQVSPKTVTRWAREGKLPFTRTLGGHRRYPRGAIRQLAADLGLPDVETP